MILAVDTYYYDDKAKTVCVGFNDWPDDKPSHVHSEILDGIAAYEPGAFYKRELPCILSLLKRIDGEKIDVIVVDGFVVLDDTGKLGLGGHLYNALEKKIPVIGVAKSRFFQNTKYVKELFRGNSKNPLYISAVGIELDESYELVKNMNGPFRIPTLFQLLDSLTKDKINDADNSVH